MRFRRLRACRELIIIIAVGAVRGPTVSPGTISSSESCDGAKVRTGYYNWVTEGWVGTMTETVVLVMMATVEIELVLMEKVMEIITLARSLDSYLRNRGTLTLQHLLGFT